MSPQLLSKSLGGVNDDQGASIQEISGGGFIVAGWSGAYKFANGDQYDGQMKEGKFNGYGTLLGAKGTKYVGWFADGKFNGNGTFTTRQGRTYTGDFKDDLLNGKGIVKEKDGKVIYDGQFKDGQPVK